MRGVGGPLLCIGDLLSDVGEGETGGGDRQESDSLSPSSSNTAHEFANPSQLPHLFQENYNQLTEALKGTDHSWTVLTLKLCSALETADKLIHTANSNVEKLSEKVEVLESIMKRGDRAVATAKTILNRGNKKHVPSLDK